MNRQDFPILNQTINGKQLVYFDNAASTQKPIQVIDSIRNYYENYHSNIHRGAHFLANKATEAYENAREIVKTFINANSTAEINYTKGTTEGINLLAHSFGKHFIKKGDEILITAMEHHANIVPWQIICEEKEAVLKVIPVNENGELQLEELESLLSEKTKLVSMVWVSNALGTVNPVNKLIETVRNNTNAKILLDAAQAIQHIEVDVQAIDCDFLVFSAHKLYGPTGTGILYGKEHLMEVLPPYQSGGEMIKEVSFNKTTYNNLPYKFEAGTPNICGGIALGAAIEYLQKIGINAIAKHEGELLKYATNKMENIEGLKLYGQAKHKTSVISFLVDGIHPYDLGVLLDKQGVATRTGHHCCMPLMQQYGIEGTCRISFGLYNTKNEVDIAVDALEKSISILNPG